MNSMGEMTTPILPLNEDSVTTTDTRLTPVASVEVVRSRGRGLGMAKFSLESEGYPSVNGRKDSVDSLRIRSRRELQAF